MTFVGLVERTRANRRKGRAIEDWFEWGVGAGLLLKGCISIQGVLGKTATSKVFTAAFGMNF